MCGKVATAPSGVKRLAARLDAAERRVTNNPSDEARHELFVARSDYRRALRQRAINVRVGVPVKRYEEAQFYRQLRMEVLNALQIKKARDEDGTERQRIEAATTYELLYMKLERTAEVMLKRKRGAAERARIKKEAAVRAIRFARIMEGSYV